MRCNIPSESELNRAKDMRFTRELHDKLRRASVAIAGAGGLGSNVAVMLARAGIGHLHIVDYDIVDITNLNRQAYTIRHIGMRKVDAISNILLEINPYMKVTTENIMVDESNCVRIFGGFDLVCEAFDRASAKSMLVSTLLSETGEQVVVSGSGMAGYGDANAIKSRCVTKRLYICGDETTDVSEGIGLMAPRVSICSGHQANLIVRLILGEA